MFWVEPLQTMSNPVISTLSGEEVPDEEKSRDLCNTIVNQGVKRVDKEKQIQRQQDTRPQKS